MVQNGRVGVLSPMSSIYSMSFILTKLKQREQKINKKWATLDPSLHFGYLNHELSLKLFFLWFEPIGFPLTTMPFRLNHNLICPGPLSKGLGTNLKLLTNKNAQFHWSLHLGPLSKVAGSNSSPNSPIAIYIPPFELKKQYKQSLPT